MLAIMKAVILILVLFACNMASAQPSSNDLKKHQKKVERSVQKQEAVWSLDTVFHAGQPVCLAVQQNKVLWSYDVSVRSLYGEELIYLKEEFYPPGAPAGSSGREHWFVWTFFPSMQKAEVQNRGLYNMDKLSAHLVEEGLVAGNGLDSLAVVRFVTIHGTKLTQKMGQAAAVPGANTYLPVERNRNMPVMVMGTEVKQANVLIGRIQERTDYTGGRTQKEIRVSLPNGTLVARATATGATGHTWQVMVMQHGRTFTVQGRTGRDAEAVVKFLVEGYYL
jgi:hypothetical protein